MSCRTNRALCAALILAVTVGAVSADASETRTKAPNFRAVDMSGERFTLEEILGKGPIIVDFWATWCKPCLKELPHLQQILDKYEDQGLQVLAVTIDAPKFHSQAKRMMKSKKYGFRVVLDAEQDVFRKLQGKGSIPYVVVIDSEGYMRYQHTGYRPGDEKELERIVVDLLAEGREEDATPEGDAAEDADAIAPTESAG